MFCICAFTYALGMLCLCLDGYCGYPHATPLTGDPTSLLGVVFAANTSEELLLGGFATVTNTNAVGWQWVDGTSSAAMNCGSRGCLGLWAYVQPEYVYCDHATGHTLPRLLHAMQQFLTYCPWPPANCAGLVECYVLPWALYPVLHFAVDAAPLGCQTTSKSGPKGVAWTTRLSLMPTCARRTCVPRASIPWVAWGRPLAVAPALHPPAATAGWA
jgi:hypothetical protein